MSMSILVKLYGAYMKYTSKMCMIGLLLICGMGSSMYAMAVDDIHMENLQEEEGAADRTEDSVLHEAQRSLLQRIVGVIPILRRRAEESQPGGAHQSEYEPLIRRSEHRDSNVACSHNCSVCRTFFRTLRNERGWGCVLSALDDVGRNHGRCAYYGCICSMYSMLGLAVGISVGAIAYSICGCIWCTHC